MTSTKEKKIEIGFKHFKLKINLNHNTYEHSDHQVTAYPRFLSMRRLGVFLLPPGWDASPSQGMSPPTLMNLLIPIYTTWWRGALRELSALPKNTSQYMACLALESESYSPAY